MPEPQIKTIPCPECKAPLTITIPNKFKVLDGEDLSVVVFEHEKFKCEQCGSLYSFTIDAQKLSLPIGFRLLKKAERRILTASDLLGTRRGN